MKSVRQCFGPEDPPSLRLVAAAVKPGLARPRACGTRALRSLLPSGLLIKLSVFGSTNSFWPPSAIADVGHLAQQRAPMALRTSALGSFGCGSQATKLSLWTASGKRPCIWSTITGSAILLPAEHLPADAVPAHVHHALLPVNLDPLGVLRPVGENVAVRARPCRS